MKLVNGNRLWPAYVERDKAELYRMADWAGQMLKLTEWTIVLCVDDKPPKWSEDQPKSAGRAYPNKSTRHAMIWICPRNNLAFDHVTGTDAGLDPAHTLFHEFAHVWQTAMGWPYKKRRAEYAANLMATLLLEHWNLQFPRTVRRTRNG